MATASSQTLRNPPATEYPARTISASLQSVKASMLSESSTGMRGRIDLTDLTQNNIGQLRKLNSVLFPVRFSEKWYKDVLDKDVQDVCKFGLFNDIPVANVCCRFEREGLPDGKVRLYIMTLGCLAPYRRIGIARTLLNHVLDVAGPGKTVSLRDANDTSISSTGPAAAATKSSNSKDGGKQQSKSEPKRREYVVETVYLHVQTSNEDAKAFYESNDFVVSDRIEEYYKTGITPRSAWLLEKRQG